MEHYYDQNSTVLKIQNSDFYHTIFQIKKKISKERERKNPWKGWENERKKKVKRKKEIEREKNKQEKNYDSKRNFLEKIYKQTNKKWEK